MDIISFKGNCLLAMPGMNDRYFRSALVFITAVDRDHVRGLIVNKASDQYISQVFSQMKINVVEGFQDQKILFGGPLRRDRLFLVYPHIDRLEQGGQEFCSSDIDDLQMLAQSEGLRYIACIGECEWTHAQLIEEVENNLWMLLPCNQEILIECHYTNRVHVLLSRLGISIEQISSASGRA